MNVQRRITVQLHEIRKYPSEEGGPRSYFDAADLSAVDIHSVPPDVFRKSRYIEAVHSSGRALVLKNTDGETGPIPSTTEMRGSKRTPTWNDSAT